MAESFSNDNLAEPGTPRGPGPDAYGHAALLLVESVLHGLIETSVFSVEKAIEVVDLAAEVKVDVGPELGHSPEVVQRSLTLLAAISGSLQGERRL